MFVRLIAAADDAGNYYGDPALVLAYLFGHRMAKGEVSVADIDEWMDELVTNSLISVYGAEIKCIHINNARRRHRTDVKPDYRFPAYSGNDVDEHRSESVTDAARTRDENVPSDADADADAEENLLVVEADQRTKIDKDRDELMDYLNHVTGRSGASKFTSHGGLKERLKAGVSVDDLKLVIDFKQTQWGHDEKMRSFVRPKTLFGPENFPGYLSEAQDWARRGRQLPSHNRQSDDEQTAEQVALYHSLLSRARSCQAEIALERQRDVLGEEDRQKIAVLDQERVRHLETAEEVKRKLKERGVDVNEKRRA